MQSAAVQVQKYLKGFIIRKRFSSFVKLYFLFKRFQKRSLVKEVSSTLRECFMQVKQIRKAMLEVFVNGKATLIQKVFRGWYLRQRVKPLEVRKAFFMRYSRRSGGVSLLDKMRGLIQGWRVRRIMKTKEVANHIKQVKDYQAAYFDIRQSMQANEHQSKQLQKSLLQSRTTTIVKMLEIIHKIQHNGIWLKYAKDADSSLAVHSASKSHRRGPLKSGERPANSSRVGSAAGKPT